MVAAEPVTECPRGRLEGELRPRDGVRCERGDLRRLGRGGSRPADDPRLERDRHDGRLEPGVQPDDLARIDDQSGLLERLPDRRLLDGLVHLEDPAGLGQQPDPRRDPAADQDELARLGHRERRDHEARIDIRDMPAIVADEPVAMLARDLAEVEAPTAVRAVVEAGRQPARDAATRAEVGGAAVGTALQRGRHAATTTSAPTTSAASPMRLTATHASRKRPLPRSTSIHAHAERQIRKTASPVVTTSSGVATRTHSFTIGLPSPAPSSRAVIATAPQISTTTERLM